MPRETFQDICIKCCKKRSVPNKCEKTITALVLRDVRTEYTADQTFFDDSSRGTAENFADTAVLRTAIWYCKRGPGRTHRRIWANFLKRTSPTLVANLAGKEERYRSGLEKAEEGRAVVVTSRSAHGTPFSSGRKQTVSDWN